MTNSTRPARRTQAERRQTTIAGLVDATIEAITDLGYARASVKEICQRAGVSQGALFRHFPTRQELVVLAAEEVSRRQLAWFLECYQQELRSTGDTMISGLAAMRRAARQPINGVWFELVTAAHTDRELYARLRPSIEERYRRAAQFGRVLLGDRYPQEFQEPLVYTLIHLFNGEAIAGRVFPMPELGERELKAVIDAVAEGLAASGRTY